MMTRIEKPNHRQPRWCIAAAFLMLAALNTSILANQPGPRSMDGARAPGEASAQDAQRQPFTPRNDAILVEGFEDISTLTAQGWVKTNQSSPLGTTGWFQGSPVIFPAQAGPDSSYIAANFENASGSGTVDNWLITPVLPLAQLTELSFWTRSPDDSTFPDRIQVWMNITNTGSDTSDFTVLLADIDPVSTSGWSQTVITSFPDAPAEGRIAFRYFVPNGGPLGSASDFIGIDTLEVLASSPEDHFVTTWQTDNPGTSSDSSITVPMVGGPFDVDWNNDGTFDQLGITGPVTHDFGTPGTYTIRIRGNYDAIRFANDGDKDKILSIDQWGTRAWQAMEDAFYGASSLEVPAADTPNFSEVTNMLRMFWGANLANPDTSNWDTGAVTVMFGMFVNTSSANPNTSGWDTSAVTNMSNMFGNAAAANPDTSNWNTAAVTDMAFMFAAAFAATPDTSGWDTSAVTTMFAMFNNAHSANPDTSGWNTVAVTDMTGMFLDAPAANPDASNWDMGSLVNAEIMFNGSGLTTANYEALVEGWADQTVQSNVSLGALGKFYCSNLAATARAVLADDNQWTITDAGRGCQVGGEVTGLQGSGLILQLNGGNDLAINDNGSFTFPGSLDNLADYTVTVAAQPGNPTQICTVANGTGTVEGPNVTNVAVSCVDDPPEGHFVTTWQTDNPGTSSDSSITVPMVGGPFDVDWNNDGTFDQLGITGPVTHDFGSPGTYTIRIRGNYDAIRFSNTGDKDKILSINQWGTRAWQSMEDAFSGASNLEVPATDTPDFSEVTSMSFMFNRATVANPDTRHWDTSSVESMRFMFNRAESADPDTSQWDTSSVEDMRSMFSRAESADPDTSSWHTSSVRDMRGMFDGASSSNPDTSSWNTSSVESMQDMFRGAIAADPDTSNWDTSSVESMWGMFQGAENANPNTSQWETGSVTNMRRMFQDAMTANPDTSQWNTAALARTTSMFEGASAANPDTSDWNVESLILAGDMFKSSGLTTANYEALLEGWSLQADAQTDVAFGAPDNFYCSDSAAVARAVLVDDKQWTISDLGRGCAIGGEVAGLQGSGLILQLNGGNDLDINDNGSFTFPGSLDNLADYTVTVAAQPVDPAQICVVANGTGTVEGPNVANVEVSCQAAEDSIFSSRFEQAR